MRSSYLHFQLGLQKLCNIYNFYVISVDYYADILYNRVVKKEVNNVFERTRR